MGSARCERPLPSHETASNRDGSLPGTPTRMIPRTSDLVKLLANAAIHRTVVGAYWSRNSALPVRCRQAEAVAVP